MDTILIRADASWTTGYGHVGRCRALVEACARGGQSVHFVTNSDAAAVDGIRSAGAEVIRSSGVPGSAEDAKHMLGLVRTLHASAIVVDGYHLGAPYVAALRPSDALLVAIDDSRASIGWDVDMVVNQTMRESSESFQKDNPKKRLLLGTRFAMIRQEFTQLRGAWESQGRTLRYPGVDHHEPVRVLVTMGGSDPNGWSEQVVEALRSYLPLDITVVLGAGVKDAASVRSRIEAGGYARVEVAPLNVAARMHWADIVVAAAGVTAWELACVGAPTVLIATVDNQIPVAEELDQIGAAIYVVDAARKPDRVGAAVSLLASDPQRRSTMSMMAQDVIDGFGAARVADEICGYDLRLRPAAPTDCRTVWRWSNAPATRAASFSPDNIPWESHVMWFRSKLDGPSHFLIGETRHGTPVGVVRYDPADDELVVSIALEPLMRGRGFGPRLLIDSARLVRRGDETKIIRAYVREDNRRSAQAFRKAGYVESGGKLVHGVRALQYTLGYEQ